MVLCQDLAIFLLACIATSAHRGGLIFLHPFIKDNTYDIPANPPDFMGIVPIFEFQNQKKLGHSDFQEEKKYIFFCKNLELGC